MPEITRPILHDFLAGVDPTGTHTFQYGMQDEQAAGGSKAHQQYAKGQTSQQEMVRQFAPKMQKTSAFLSGARKSFSEYKIL